MRGVRLLLAVGLAAGACSPRGLPAPPPADQQARSMPMRRSDFERRSRGSCGEGSASLFRGASADDAAIVRACIAVGIDVDTLDGRGLSPLGVAAGAGALSAMAVLLAADASVEPIRAEEYPLALAVRGRRLEAARMLLVAGARPYARNDSSLLAYAVGAGDRSLALLLLDHGADPEGDRGSAIRPLFYAVLRCDDELVERLLETGASPDRAHMPAAWSLDPATQQHCVRVDRLLQRSQARTSTAQGDERPGWPRRLVDLILPPDR